MLDSDTMVVLSRLNMRGVATALNGAMAPALKFVDTCITDEIQALDVLDSAMGYDPMGQYVDPDEISLSTDPAWAGSLTKED